MSFVKLLLAAMLGLGVGFSVNFTGTIKSSALASALAATYGCQPKPYIPRCRWNGKQFVCPPATIRGFSMYAYSRKPGREPTLIIQPRFSK